MMRHFKLLLITIQIFLFSCHSDKPIDIDPFSDITLENIMEYIPFDLLDNNSKIEFVNENGDLKIMNINKTVVMQDKMIEDESYKAETITYDLTENDVTDYKIVINATGLYNEPGKPIVFLTVMTITNLTNGAVPLINIFEDGQTVALPRGDIDLLGNTFSDVISSFDRSLPPSSFYKLHYNFEFGIVGFDDVNNELWVFKNYQ